MENETIFTDEVTPLRRKLEGYHLFREVFKSPKFILAPMVDGSELPFRLLTRRYGVDLAYTPMMYPIPFAQSKRHREKIFTTCPEDRPLIAQFCGSDPDEILKAAKLAQTNCDAIDINFGCPQQCARKGGYGSYLLDYPETILDIVNTLHQNLEVPVTCKIRVLPSLEETIDLAVKIQDAGCQMLAVHGRTRDEKGKPPPPAKWDYIREVKRHLRIPVVANGSIDNYDDAMRCLEETGADSVMSGYGLLYNPLLFSNQTIEGNIERKFEVAREYLELVQQYPAERKAVDLHLFPLLREGFDIFPEMKAKFAKRKWTEDPMKYVAELEGMMKNHFSNSI